jgi:LmbE family N-acetylglucosaminyl deacetylase
MNNPAKPPLSPKVVLGIAAHPDDLDYTASGSMAAFAAQGADVYYLILTDGGKGSSDREMTTERLRDMRREEQRNAAKIIGLKDVFFLDYPDGALENTQDLKRDIVKVIRQVKPDVVVTLDPLEVYSAASGIINHPDHRAAGQAALDAVYPLARGHMTFPELLEQGLEPHETPTVLLAGWFGQEKPTNFAVNITDTIDLKFKALEAHESQFGSLEALAANMRQKAAKLGTPYAYNFAEAFIRIDVD